jgi:integrase
VQEWVTTLSKNLSASQTRSVFLNFSAMLDYAIKDKRLRLNPCQDVRLPKIVKTKKKYLTHNQLWMLADECKGQGDVVLFLGYLGLRFNELAAITMSNINFDKRRIQIENQLDVKKKRVTETRPTKTNGERQVVFPEFLDKLLEERCMGKGLDDYVFTAPKGGPLRLENFRRDFYAPALASVIASDPTFARVTVHNLRNTAASLAVSSGANIKSLQKMLGHARASMTLDTYAELFDDDVESVAIALNKDALTAIVGKTWANLKFEGEEIQ